MNAPPARLLSLATAAPPHTLRQEDALELASKVYGEGPDGLGRMAEVFVNAGIRTRRLAQPLDWYLEPRDWPERTRAYLEAADFLFREAASAALQSARLSGEDVDAIVTVSSTGIATPSLEARSARTLGFGAQVSRTPVFGLGCAGGVSGLSLAARLAQARPGSRVLLVVVELCTLSFRMDEATKVNIVATALFGDGAAACVLSTEGDGAAIVGSAEYSWPDTLDIMGWRVDADAFGVIFDRAIPPFARRRMGGAVDAMLDAMGLERGGIDRFVCHPGGAKVIQALEGALALASGSLDAERQVLADYGNMSAPTALFVLDQVLARGDGGRLFLTALGPGFTASGVVLDAR